MIRAGATVFLILALAACSQGLSRDNPYAPGVSRYGESVDGMTVGHRLMAAGEFDLALDAFTRAAAEDGIDSEVIAALGSANLGLGRLGQAERLLRQAVKSEQAAPETWNNLGVVLMEKGEFSEAVQIFQRAYALDNGESDAIRENLRLALAKFENYEYGEPIEQDYKLVRRGSSDYLIRSIP